LLLSKIPNARVLTFGYDAYVADWRGMVSKNKIGNHSWNLLTALATYREDDNTVRLTKWSSLGIELMAADDRPVIFVCHSLGGLVCEDVGYAAIGNGSLDYNDISFVNGSTATRKTS
jgi:hypothetical protein